MRYLTGALIGALLLFSAPRLNAEDDDGPISAQRFVNYLTARHIEYVAVTGPAVETWWAEFQDATGKLLPAPLIIVTLNRETDKGIAWFVAEGVVRARLRFSISKSPIPLHSA